MPITYAKGRIRYVSEDDLSVRFVRDTNRADGSAGDKQYLNLIDGGWDNEYDAVKHLRRLHRDPDREHRQSFAAPDDFLVEPQADAEVFVVDSRGEIVSDCDSVGSNEAYSLVRRFASRP